MRKKILPICQNGKLEIYEVSFNKQAKEVLEKLKLEYGELKLGEVRKNHLLNPGGKPTWFTANYGHKRFEEKEWEATTVWSNGNIGGPVYADVTANVFYYPELYMILSKLMAEDKVELRDLYYYMMRIAKVDINVAALGYDKKEGRTPSGVIFTHSLPRFVLTEKEKALAKGELTPIIKTFNNFTSLKLVTTKLLKGEDVIIDSSISIRGLEQLKEEIKLGQLNGEIVKKKNFKDIVGDLQIEKPATRRLTRGARFVVEYL